ncbi:MAG: alginate lyase family protein [Nocardioidaceae bacterium]
MLAKALVYARTGVNSYRSEVTQALRAVMGTEGESTLALGRELAAYLIAADLIGLQEADPVLDATFRGWLSGLLDRTLAEGDSLTSTHERRPNNWGTRAGASRAVVAAYLGDTAELGRVAKVFRGWVGDRTRTPASSTATTAESGIRPKDSPWARVAMSPKNSGMSAERSSPVAAIHPTPQCWRACGVSFAGRAGRLSPPN